MNLLTFCDYHEHESVHTKYLYQLLDEIDVDSDITKVIVCDDDPFSSSVIAWALDRDVDWTTYNSSRSKFPLTAQNTPPNNYLRKIVDDYKVDGFGFFFTEKQKRYQYAKHIRNFYSRANKAFKRQLLYTTHFLPPSS